MSTAIVTLVVFIVVACIGILTIEKIVKRDR